MQPRDGLSQGVTMAGLQRYAVYSVAAVVLSLVLPAVWHDSVTTAASLAGTAQPPLHPLLQPLMAEQAPTVPDPRLLFGSKMPYHFVPARRAHFGAAADTTRHPFAMRGLQVRCVLSFVCVLILLCSHATVKLRGGGVMRCMRCVVFVVCRGMPVHRHTSVASFFVLFFLLVVCHDIVA